VLAVAFTVAAIAPRRSSADVITIHDGAQPGTTKIPFTCTKDTENNLWPPAMGFIYRNVENFELVPGDTIAFDIQMPAGDPDDLGFRPELDIALAHASDPLTPFKPDDLPGSDFTIVAHDGIASGAGNRIVEDYDLVFTVDAPFSFPGGGLIIRVTNPKGVLADTTLCRLAITADTQPSGTNRLVGTFTQEVGEYPWLFENTINTPNVPYVRITWTRCGDGRVSGTEVCDDGNTDDTDGCARCQPARCGDGFVQATEECDDGNADNTDDCANVCKRTVCGDGFVQAQEECDNSANPDHPDPFCDDSCHLAAFAKGSGCSSGGGAGLVAAALALLVLARRRRATGLAIVFVVGWAGSAQAQLQRKTDGFRVDRFEMAPSVDDGIVVQDPGVLGHLVWNLNAGLGYSTTILRVVPRLSSDNGVDVVGPRLSAYLDFALGLRDRVELNVAVPFALAQSSQSGMAAGIMLKSAGTSAIGDARVGGSVLLYGRHTGPQVGLAATVAIPVGSKDSFTGDGGVGLEVLATGSFVGPGYRLIGNAGVRVRPEAAYVSTDQGTELIGRGGIVVPMARERLMASLEFDVIARASGSDAGKALGSPILGLLGARYHFSGGVWAGAGVGAGLTEAPGSPSLRTLFTVGYSPEPRPLRPAPAPRPVDVDGDGILDKDDQCPFQREDFNGVEDEDGCPEGDHDTDKLVDNEPPGGPLTLEQVVSLPAPIEFKFDTAIMLPGAEVYLNQVLDVLQKHPDVLKLEIQGHTSSEGGAEYNLRLSNDRAKAVHAWLVDHGIDAKRLVPHGYGLTVPLFPNDTEPHRQRNRRVQFRILEQIPEAAPAGAQPGAKPPPGANPAPANPAPAKPAPGVTPAPATPAGVTPAPAATAPPATPPPAAAPLAPARP